MAYEAEDRVALMEEAAAEAAAQPKPVANLAAVNARAERLIAIEREMEDAEATLKRLKKEREKIRVFELPPMMFELGMTSVGINNRVVQLEDLIQGTLPSAPAAREATINYVESLGEGGVVKRQLELQLPKGDAVMEQRVLDALNAVDRTLVPRITPTIHASTYAALCRRLVNAGKTLDLQRLNCFVGRIARVKD